MISTRRLIIVAAIAGTVAGVAACDMESPASATPLPASRPANAHGPLHVQFVTDGDTIGVRTGGGVERVRLIGVDTPETKKPGAGVQCWGPQASRMTASLLQDKKVWLESDPVAGTKDRYGRRLAYVWLGDRLVNHALIERGAGREYAFSDQRYRYRGAFENAEHSARTADRGLWGACD